jgi:DNA-binding FrmR family transcriptional regulator
MKKTETKKLSDKNEKKQKSLKLAKQARGTLDKVIVMMEEGVYCPEIIQQVDSVNGLLRSVKKEMLAGHLDTCVLNRLKENKTGTIEELLKIYNLSN